jgi:hypothetical protein
MPGTPGSSSALPSAVQRTGTGSASSPMKLPSGPRFLKASMTHRPARSRIRRPLYNDSSVTRTAWVGLNGPSRDVQGTNQIPPRIPALRRSSDSSAVRQEKTSTGRPSTTSTCGTSRWPKPPPGRLSGAWACQWRRSCDRACPITPRWSAGPSQARAVSNMCQPSPPGSANTHGSRQASSGHSASGSRSYQRGSLCRTGEPGCLLQWWRSAEVARPMRCLRACSWEPMPV